MNKIGISLAFIIVLSALMAYLSPVFDTNRETICICSEKSPDEIIIFNQLIIHNGRVFPLDGEKRSGCLMLYDFADAGSAKYRSWWQFAPFARFVEDDYDHCCRTGQ
jgi:hypothetical protein